MYRPWGRPDMALFKFTEAMLADNGRCRPDQPENIYRFAWNRDNH
ncbi:hypothetical protein [Pseudomonas sp. KU43P]|nr:hypothetical protein [Pseudomonas sp. KU43P]